MALEQYGMSDEDWLQADVFDIIALAASAGHFGRVIVKAWDVQTSTWMRVADLPNPISFEEFRQKYRPGKWKLQVIRSGAPGGSIAEREVAFAPQTDFQSLSTPAISNQTVPDAQQPVQAHSPQPSERERELEREIQRMRDEREKDRLARVEEERARERKAAQEEITRLNNQIADLARDVKAMREAPPVKADASVAPDRYWIERADAANQRLLELAQNGKSSSDLDALRQVAKIKELVGDVFESRDPGTLEKVAAVAGPVLEKLLGAVDAFVTSRAESKAQQAQQAQQVQPVANETQHPSTPPQQQALPAPDQNAEPSDNVIEGIPMSEIHREFLMAAATGMDVGARESLERGLLAVLRVAGGDGLNDLVEEYEPYTRLEYVEKEDEDELRMFLMSQIPVLMRPLLASQINKPEARAHVLAVLREFRKWIDGINAGNEADIALLKTAA